MLLSKDAFHPIQQEMDLGANDDDIDINMM